MAKLSFNPPPTWQKKVAIPVPGGTADVVFTFRRRGMSELKEFLSSTEERNDKDMLLDVVVGWDLDDIFDGDAVEKMVGLYPGSASRILSEYLNESMGRPIRIADIEALADG